MADGDVLKIVAGHQAFTPPAAPGGGDATWSGAVLYYAGILPFVGGGVAATYQPPFGAYLDPEGYLDSVNHQFRIPAGKDGIFTIGVDIRHADPSPNTAGAHLVWSSGQSNVFGGGSFLITTPEPFQANGYTANWFGGCTSPPTALVANDTVALTIVHEFFSDPGPVDQTFGDCFFWITRLGNA